MIRIFTSAVVAPRSHTRKAHGAFYEVRASARTHARGGLCASPATLHTYELFRAWCRLYTCNREGTGYKSEELISTATVYMRLSEAVMVRTCGTSFSVVTFVDYTWSDSERSLRANLLHMRDEVDRMSRFLFKIEVGIGVDLLLYDKI